MRACPFVGESDDPLFSDISPDSGEMAVEATGITMVSPPDSSEENENGEQFNTPPGESLAASSSEMRPAAVDRLDDRTVDQVPDIDGDEETVAANGARTDEETTVHLRRDADLGFSEVELTVKLDGELNAETSRGIDRRHESEVFHSEPDPVRFLTRELSSKEGLGESPLKKFKISGKNLGYESPSHCVGTVQQINTEKLFKSFEKLKSKVISPYKHETPRVCLSTLKEKNKKNLLNSLVKLKTDDRDSLHNDGNKFHHKPSEIGAENLAKRKLNFSTEPVDTETGESNGTAGFGEERGKDGAASNEVLESGVSKKVTSEANRPYSTKDNDSGRKREEVDRFRYVGPTAPNLHRKMEGTVQFKRALPLSISGLVENADEEMTSRTLSPRIHQKITLLDVLKILADRCHSDPDLENLSILEVAKRRGMTFP